jgi:hypothetical protein
MDEAQEQHEESPPMHWFGAWLRNCFGLDVKETIVEIPQEEEGEDDGE